MKYVHLYADERGESHFEDVELPNRSTTTVTGVSLSEDLSRPIGDAFRFVTVRPDSDDPGAAGSGEWGPWHPEPRPEYVIFLEGEVQIEVMDGEIRTLRGGDVLLVEDTIGKGHRNRRLTPSLRSIFVPIADGPA